MRIIRSDLTAGKNVLLGRMLAVVCVLARLDIPAIVAKPAETIDAHC